MKKVKSILALVFILISSLTFAQGPGGGPGGQGGQQGPPPVPGNKQIEKTVKGLAREIALSSDQQTKVLELYKAHYVQVKAKTSGNNRPKREEMEALETALEKNVKAELNKEQESKYEAYLKKQEKNRSRQ